MKKIVYTITFLTFNGYYAILALIYFMGIIDFSRLITVPLRLITSALMLYFILTNLKNLKHKYINFIFFIFWLLYLIKVLYHHSEGYPLFRAPFDYFFYSINFAVLPFFFYSCIDFNKYKNTIISALVSSGFVLGLLCLFLYGKYLGTDLGRVGTGDTLDETLSPLALSYGSVITIGICFFQLFYKKNMNKKYRLYLYMTLLLSFIMFLLGASRGSVLAIFLSLIIILIFGGIRLKLKFIVIAILSLPIITWSVLASGSIIFTRTENTLDSGDETRSKLWSDAFTEFINYPLIGNRVEIGFYPHNFVLETAMSLGIIGLIILFMILNYGTILVLQKIKIDKNYILVLMLFVQGLAQHSFSGAIYTAIMIFFPLGLMYSIYYNGKKMKYDN